MCLRIFPSTFAFSRKGWATIPCTDRSKSAKISLASSMAKMYCTEMAVRTASQCVQVHGAIGLAAESQPQRLLRDARMYTIAGGTTQIQTLIIGRELTGLSALR